MPDRPTQHEPTEPAEGAAMLPANRLVRLFGRIRAWAYGHWLRGVAIAGIILSLIAFTMAGWAYLASVALRAGAVSIDAAFQALDEGRHEEARAAVAQMLRSGLLPRNEYGGPLLVLGAVKIHDAENEPSAERRRVEYLVASRYLEEARAHGFPPQRSRDGNYMLGKSLVESGQFNEGLRVLDELLAITDESDTQAIRETRQLLADTCLLMPKPQVQKALQYNQALLEIADLTDQQRASALMQQAECLSRLERFEEAQQSVTAVPPNAVTMAAIKVLSAKIQLDEVEASLLDSAVTDRTTIRGDWKPKIVEARQLLQEAVNQDPEQGYIARQANYQIGRALDLQGDRIAALKQFARTRQFYSDSIEGLASALAEADLLREDGDYDAALLGYRRVLEDFKSIPIYRSHALPVAQIRERIMSALKEFVERRRFVEALTLIDHSRPLFSHAEQLELRGGTRERWGQLLLNQASDESAQSKKLRTSGLRKLRAAGVDFEQLAGLRFASRPYSTDLWHSAENYFAGHSFTSTIRLLNEYLENEPELRNAQALLRLGQAYLAIGQIPQSIASFEECIEFHPLDSSTFQARIDCAKAYWQRGEIGRAEELLRDNIAGSTLRPSSREWKDSLFELGMLLHETSNYQQAIVTLEEAIERYPQDPQRLIAQYVLGESYRRDAQQLLEQAEQARTAGERDKVRERAVERLATALKHFEEVQVSITLKTHDLHSDPLQATMLRNCYMLEGTVLFDLGRFKEAIESYSNVASLYPNNPFVLETFVQIANCWRRLGQNNKARGAIQQAQIALQEMPTDADFSSATPLNREEWGMLLADMSKW